MPDSIAKKDSFFVGNDSPPALPAQETVHVVREAPPASTQFNNVVVPIAIPDCALPDSIVAEADTIAVIAAADSTTIKVETGFEGIPLPKTSYENWFGLALMLIVFLLVRSRHIISDRALSLFSLKRRKKLSAKFTVQDLQNLGYMLFIAFIGFSLFVYKMIDVYADFFSMTDFLLAASGVMFFFLFKYFSFSFLGNIFFDRNTTRIWLKDFLTLFLLCGIVLLPISVLMYNANIPVEIPIISGIITIGITVILTIYKLVRVFFQKGFSIFYLLLYLCSLEIIPVLVLWKTLTK